MVSFRLTVRIRYSSSSDDQMQMANIFNKACILILGEFMREDLLLMIPGPTIVPARINRAMSAPIIPHRGKEFSEMFLEQMNRLKGVFRTKNDVYVLCGSGTAAMEAALSNTISPDDKVLCLVNGKFSERFAEIASSFGADVLVLESEWGHPVDVESVADVLSEHPDIKVVTMVFNETSTGVRNPVEDVGELVRHTNAILVVDTISALAGDVFETDLWNVDICVSGSQKCFALPPGLAFISLSDKAWEVIDSNDSYAYYLDLKRYRKDKAHAPYTPPVSLVYGLKESLDIIDEEGLENRWERHKNLANIAREGLKDMGFELFPIGEEWCSNTVTAARVPEDFDVSAFKKILSSRFGIEIAGGQADLKGKIFRVGHMGVATEREVYTTLVCIELALEEL